MSFESVIVFSLFQVSFLLGYIMGRHSSPSSVTKSNNQPNVFAPQESESSFSIPKQQPQSKKNISIDDSKFVTNFEESLQGNGKSLGRQTTVTDDVSSSVSKLAQLKRNK
jgi:hypothetical protein